MVCLFVLLCAAGNVGDVFAINSSGFILVAKKLDRETKSVYELTITAEDRAGIFFLLNIKRLNLGAIQNSKESHKFCLHKVFFQHLCM